MRSLLCARSSTHLYFFGDVSHRPDLYFVRMIFLHALHRRVHDENAQIASNSMHIHREISGGERGEKSSIRNADLGDMNQYTNLLFACVVVGYKAYVLMCVSGTIFC